MPSVELNDSLVETSHEHKKKKKKSKSEIETECDVKKVKKEKKSKRRHSVDAEVIDGADGVAKKSRCEETVIVEDQDADDYKGSTKKEDSDIPENLRISSHDLSQSTVNSLQQKGIKQLFPIQAASLAPIMKGQDLLGRARTGTGKTLAFSLPMVETLKRRKTANPSEFSRRGRAPKVMIMAPTRELAIQVHREFDSIASGELSSTCIYGGTAFDGQCQAMRSGLDAVIGTPGRLIDHIERGNLKLDQLLFICMDEADQMLDIGFAESMEKILEETRSQKASLSSAPEHQTLLFSATMPIWIKEAVKKYMRPDKITLDLIGNDKQKTSSLVKHFALASRWQNRADVLGDIVAVYGRGSAGRTIIFVEKKGEANDLAMNDKLVAMGTQVLHGDIPQKQREITMQGFRDGKFTSLIATNVCARGVDIPEVDLVINCEPPSDVESYIHRSGRTGRAGKSGVCVTFYKADQVGLLQNISRRAGVDFAKIGAPQAKDIVAAHAAETLETVKTDLDDRVLEYFTSCAKDILDHFKGDAEKALSATLAVLCNTTKPLPARSLLSANEGFITLLFKVDNEIRHFGYVKSIVQRNYPELKYEDTVGWRMTAGSKGVVVDVTESKVEVIENGDGETPTIKLGGIEWQDGRGVTLEIPKELPELEERFGGQQMSNGRGYRGGSRGGSSYGNSRGGRGGSSSYGSGSRGGFRGGSSYSGGRFTQSRR